MSKVKSGGMYLSEMPVGTLCCVVERMDDGEFRNTYMVRLHESRRACKFDYNEPIRYYGLIQGISGERPRVIKIRPDGYVTEAHGLTTVRRLGHGHFYSELVQRINLLSSMDVTDACL